MNKRLIDLYEKIRKMHRDDFLNSRIELAEKWNSSVFGINLQIEPGKEVNNLINRIQENISSLEDDNVICISENARHISVYSVIQWNDVYRSGHRAAWDVIKDDLIKKFLNLNGMFYSFDITFDTLIAAKGGLILCGHDQADQLEKIRNVFQNELPVPAETLKQNHAIHISALRYKRLLNNPEAVFKYAGSFDKKAEMRVKNLKLINELKWPSLEIKEIASAGLK